MNHQSAAKCAVAGKMHSTLHNSNGEEWGVLKKKSKVGMEENGQLLGDRVQHFRRENTAAGLGTHPQYQFKSVNKANFEEVVTNATIAHFADHKFL